MNLKYFIYKTTNELIRENHNIIKEGVNEVDELKKLANEIILTLAEKNYRYLIKLVINGFDKISSTKLDRNRFYIDRMVRDIPKYKILKEFIETGLVIVFTDDMNEDGLYYSNSHISIKLNDSYVIGLKVIVDHIKTNNVDLNDEAELIRLYRICLISVLRGTILHELQHAFDDFRSKGKFKSDKLSKQYFNKYNNRLVLGGNGDMSEEQYAEYLNLPHEYWARFIEAIDEIQDFNKPFQEIVSKFKEILRGFNELPQLDKQKLLKSLYKYWSLKK